LGEHGENYVIVDQGVVVLRFDEVSTEVEGGVDGVGLFRGGWGIVLPFPPTKEG